MEQKPPSLLSFFTSARQSLRQMNRHFSDSKEEIAHNNNLSLISVSGCGIVLEIILLAITPALIPTWEVSIWHWLMLPFFLLFGMLGVLLLKKQSPDRATHVCALAFTVILLMLVLCMDLIPYRDSSATLIAIAMSVVPVLFVIPFYETTTALLMVLACFLVLNERFIDSIYASRNVFHGILGCACGIMVSWVVTNVRAEDNRGRQIILHESQYDALTDILNKVATERACCAYLDSGNVRCSLIVLDIDFFKIVNDTYGHSMGDSVLQILGTCLHSVFRESDVTGRIGGDEFLILMKGTTDCAVIRSKMEQLTQLVHQSVSEHTGIPVTCSYGAILLPAELRVSYSFLFNMADKVLYHAKQTGRNKGDVMTIAEYNQMMAARKIMLIADDVDINREILKNIFEKDYDIVEADNGQSAIDIITKHHGILGVMLLDIMMPKMGGYEVLKWLKTQKEIEPFPVITISSDGAAELPSFELGVADMITKPFNPDVVRMRVDRVMRAQV